MPKIEVTPTSGGLDALHAVLTMMAVDLDQFCSSHGITYYLMGGTALGAIRHGGFIPWDDDFDIFMDRENYLRFLSACEANLDSSKYYIQRENSGEWPLYFSKIRLNGTQYVEREEDVGKIHSGLYIDVMCLHNAYSNTTLRCLQFLAARTLSAIGLSRRGYVTTSRTKRTAIALARLLAGGSVERLLLWFVRSLDNRDTKMLGHYFGRAPLAKATYPRTILGQPRRVRFETTTLPVPVNVEDYLTIRFGPNYMQMPDQKTRDAFPTHLISYDLGPYA